MKIKQGRFVIVQQELPELGDAKRLWLEGKSAQYILEQAKRRAKVKH